MVILTINIKDKILKKNIQNGEEEALEDIIGQYGGIIKSIIIKKLGNYPEYTEECINDIFIAIWEHIDKYDPSRSSLKNWIAGIARYKCLDYLRKVYKDKREQSINGQVQVDISYIETEIEEDLDHILGGLSDIDKRIVKFRFIEGYSIEEISDQLSLSKKTVYNRIYYAKQKIIKRIVGVSDEK